MKAKCNRLLLALAMLALGKPAHAAILTWANTNGGDWTIATNWTPAQVPVSGDDIIITNGGTYAVTNCSNVTLDSLTIGGTNGIQTLTAASLTLTNASLVNSNGVLNWSAGDLESSLRVAQGGALTLSNTIYFAENNNNLGATNTAALTNYGTVIFGTGNIYGAGNTTANAGGGLVYNAGLWEDATDNQMASYNNVGTNLFINTGTLAKTGGSAASTISWGFSTSGTIQTPTGNFVLNWNAPSVLNGNLTQASGVIAAPLTVASNAVLNLSSVDLESALTILPGATLTLSNTIYFAENNNNQGYTNTAALTNYGTVIFGAGNIYGVGNTAANAGGGLVYNAGLWQAATDNQMASYNNVGTNLFINTGTLAKTGGTTSSAINWNYSNYGGTVTTAGGSFGIGNWVTSGLVYGNASFSGGTISGTLAPGAVMNFAAVTINHALIVSSNAVANWAGGDLESSLTVLPGGTLTLSNSIVFALNNYTLGYTNTAALTNYGTVIYGTGNLYGAGNTTANAGGGLVYNAGLWESAADNQMTSYDNAGTNIFINAGTLEKTAGTGVSAISWGFSNSGTIQTPTGTFSLNWTGPSTLNGNLTLAGGAISSPLTVESNAVLNLSGVDLESALTVLPGATLTLSNTIVFALNNYNLGYTNTAALTNYGTVIYGAGNLYGAGNTIANAGGGLVYNAGLWESATDNQMSSYDNAGTNIFINTGTLAKIGGAGASIISWGFSNAGGMLEPETNAISLAGNYDLAGGAVNPGISSLASFGVINLSGSPATLAGTLSATFNAGFLPAVSNSWNIVTYASATGAFSQTNLPPIAIWQVTTNPTFLKITVLKLVPQMSWTNPADIVYGAALNAAQLDAAATWNGTNVPGTFTYNPPLGTVLQSGSNQTLSVTFVPNDTATYTNNSASVTITVQKAPLAVAANARSKTYGQTVTFAGTEFTPSGLVNGDVVTNTTLSSPGASPTASVAGSPYPITVTNATGDAGLTNYIISYFNGQLTVNPAPLTITANGRSKLYGQVVVFAGTEFTPAGLQNAETVGSVLLASPGAVATASVSGSPYSIVPSAAAGGTFSAGNYTIAYANGSLTVGPAPLGITASNRGKTYGQTVTFAGTEFTPSGLQNSETVGSVTLASSGSVSNASVAGSPYNIVPSAATGGSFNPGNYSITYTSGSLTVGKAALTITAGNTNKIVGETLAFAGTEFTASGLQNSETVGSVTLASAGAAASAPIASYNIVPSAPAGGTFSQGNYSDIFVNGTLTVLAPPPLAITSLGSQYVLTFQTLPGQIYQVQSTTNVPNGTWSSLGDPINGTGGAVSVTNTISAPKAFFQLQIML